MDENQDGINRLIPDPQEAQEGLEELEGTETQEEAQEEPESFPRAYVEELRAESAANRVKGKRAEALEGALQALAVQHYARGVLADTTALQWSAELAGEDGLPDGGKIKSAAEALVAARPSLGRPQGNVLQGDHGAIGTGFSWGVLSGLV